MRFAVQHWCIPFALALFACGKAKPESQPQEPTQETESHWHDAEVRVESFAADGFVVSIDKDHNPQNQGDSLIWTGVALASMDCNHGAMVDDALKSMVRTLNGGLWRHPSLPDQISLDGALGFYLGVIHRIKHCNGAATWTSILELHKSMAPMLNAKAGVNLEAPFTVARDSVLALVGLASVPDSISIGALADAAVGLGAAPGAAHEANKTLPPDKRASDACFRAHLGLLTFQIIEATRGSVPAAQRDAFCSATRGYDMPTLDNFCGRGDLRGWVNGFQPDVWQYRHQRCPAWESPDGNKMQQPGVDLLRGMVDAYSFPW